MYAGDLRTSTSVLRREAPHKDEKPPWIHADEPSSGFQGQVPHGNNDDNDSDSSFEIISANEECEPRVTRQQVTQAD